MSASPEPDAPTESPRTFFLESAAQERALLAELSKRFRRGSGRQDRFALTGYDTFDWRLLASDGELWASDDELLWRVGGEDRATAVIPTGVDFAWNLPEGRLRDAVEPLIEMRRLLPVVAVDLTVRSVPFVDDDGKTVARLVFERGTVSAVGVLDRRKPKRGGGARKAKPSKPAISETSTTSTSSAQPVRPLEAQAGPRRRLAPTLRVATLRGYEVEGAEVLELVAAQAKPAPLEGLLARSLERVGDGLPQRRGPAKPRLVPSMTAAQAVAEILGSSLAVVEHNEEGVRRDLDSEFLHDFRVAVRRTRAVMSQLRDVFDVERTKPFRKALKWLGGVTGPTRDLDVYLLKFPKYRDALVDGPGTDLAPLEQYLIQQQRVEQRALDEALTSERYRKLLAEWRKLLRQVEVGRWITDPGQRPVQEVASERILGMYRKVMLRGSVIDADTPAQRVHDLRIDCKKLRYLLEFFAKLYDPKELKPIVRTLKSLQDLLGDFNDYEVQQHSLASIAARWSAEGQVPVETVLAMGRLVERLNQGQRALHVAFAERFAPLVAEEIRERVGRQFGGGEIVRCE